MACSSPLYGVRTKMLDKESGELFNGYVSFFAGERTVHIDNKFRFLRLSDRASELKKPLTYATPQQRLNAFNQFKEDPFVDAALIPCGRCMECRLEYSRQWANRQMLEAATTSNNWFLTLTYDDEHLPKNSKGYPTLVKTDVKKFMKDLREYWFYHYGITGIRFFAAGEYGDTSGRPHYHINMFNLPIQDAEFLFQKNNKPYFDSKIIDKIWNKGFVVIGELNWDTAAYVARYVVKKAKGATSSVYQELDIQPEFCQMSTHPGIARMYYDANKDTIYKYDKITVPGGKRVRPSHYYDKLYDIDDPCSLSLIKDKRISVAEAAQELQLKQTDLDPLTYQKNCHEALMKKIHSLQRDVI